MRYCNYFGTFLVTYLPFTLQQRSGDIITYLLCCFDQSDPETKVFPACGSPVQPDYYVILEYCDVWDDNYNCYTEIIGTARWNELKFIHHKNDDQFDIFLIHSNCVDFPKC